MVFGRISLIGYDSSSPPRLAKEIRALGRSNPAATTARLETHKSSIMEGDAPPTLRGSLDTCWHYLLSSMIPHHIRMKVTLTCWAAFLTQFLPIYAEEKVSDAPTDPPSARMAEKERDRYMGSSANWVTLRKELEGDSDNSYRRAQHLEAKQLAKGVPGVRRKDKSIFLKTRDGREVQLDDGSGDSTPSYSFYDVVPALDSYVLHAQYYEGNAWLVVSRLTGTKVEINGLPVVAPNKRRFVTGNFDLDAHYTPNDVVIWTHGDDGAIKQEWKIEPKDWGPTYLRWLSSTKFVVRCEVPYYGGNKPRPQATARTYELIEGSWQQVGGIEKWKKPN